MRIEMQHRDRPVVLHEATQGCERDAVVAAKRDDLRAGEDRRGGGPVVELAIGGGHLSQGHGVVHGGDGDVAAVGDGGPGGVGVDARTGVEAPEGVLTGGGCADGFGAEACAWELLVGVEGILETN